MIEYLNETPLGQQILTAAYKDYFRAKVIKTMLEGHIEHEYSEMILTTFPGRAKVTRLIGKSAEAISNKDYTLDFALKCCDYAIALNKVFMYQRQREYLDRKAEQTVKEILANGQTEALSDEED